MVSVHELMLCEWMLSQLVSSGAALAWKKTLRLGNERSHGLVASESWLSLCLKM